MADIVERYPAGSSTANYTGNDLTDVQTHSGAATGDVIKVSQNITVSTTIGNGATSGYSVGSFTLQGASSENPVTISGGTRLYNLPNTVTSFTLKDVTISGFVNSNSTGGAIRVNGPITINLENVTFKNNKENKHHGGGISRDNTSDLVTIVGDNLTFDGNYAKYGGGAIRSRLEISGKNKKSVITFNNNSSGYNGAIVTLGSSDDMASVFSTGTFYFTNNTGLEGGAIFAVRSLTFSGDTTAYFQNNKVSRNGNDIYLESRNSSKLTFKDAGNYSFDGGIYLANANQKTIIDKAQVTIAGRENDTTNNYVLRSVTISNGGKLTANLTEINSLSGTFNVGKDESSNSSTGTLELHVSEKTKSLTVSDSLKIFSTDKGVIIKTGEGTLKIDAAKNAVDVYSLVVSSGRLDMKEYFKGQLEVKSGAEFSPGNSVGSLEIGEGTYGGGLILNEDGAKLLMEIGGENTIQNDSLIVNGNILIGNDSIIELTLADNSQLKGGDTFTAILYGSNSGEDGFKENLLSHISSYYFTNLDYIPYGAGYAITGALDPNAVPEPSTWALLLLGAAGLMYWRKRTRK